MPSIMSRHELSRRPRKLYSQSTLKTIRSGKKIASVRSAGAGQHSVGYSYSQRASPYQSSSVSESSSVSAETVTRVESADGWGHFVDI